MVVVKLRGRIAQPLDTNVTPTLGKGCAKEDIVSFSNVSSKQTSTGVSVP
jgi:hypothetical protein